MSLRLIKADLHLHSQHSRRPSEWILRKIGCAESYSDPVKIYQLARQRGMDLFTFTDHNTIAGCLDIAHLPGTFISEEITTYFPENHCKVHVLAWGLDERLHEEIQRVRENIYDLVNFLREERVVHAVAHPLFSVNGRLTMEEVEKFLVLFNVWELNGGRDPLQNQTIRALFEFLTPNIIEDLADRHGLRPFGDTPWKKTTVGGSDDHSGLQVARSHTCVECEGEPRDFLAAVGTSLNQAAGLASGPKVLAHNLYSIAFQFYKTRFGLDRYLNGGVLLRFLEQVLTTESGEAPSVRERLRALFGYPRTRRILKLRPDNLQEMLQEQARRIILESPSMAHLVHDKSHRFAQKEDIWFSFVDRLSAKIIKHSADRALEKLASGNFLDLFSAIGSAGSLYAMLSPYLVSYSVFTKDRELCRSCETHFIKRDAPQTGQMKMAHFTDTLADVNGVARTLAMQVEISRKHGKALTLLSCGSGTQAPDVKLFEPVGAFRLPEYPLITLYYPPLLKILDYCFEEGFTHIHAATPGPMGLAALVVARILNLPFYGTYHTQFPQYAALLTEDLAMEDATWRYMLWFHNQMDKVYVPSRATGTELAAKGIPKEKIRFYERGIDTERFRPEKRNGFYGANYGVSPDERILLYVGRVSREKNLPLLVEVFKKLCAENTGLRLAVVGDGPWLAGMQQDLAGFPAIFTGFLEGEELCQAYASADLFVFPSTTDTFGNVVLEAQASGVPVIVSDQGGPQENLLDGETGLVVPANDAEAFAEAVTKLLENPERRQRMSEASRRFLEDQTFESSYLRLWESYREPACA